MPTAHNDVDSVASGVTLHVTVASSSDVLHNDVSGADGFAAGGGVVGVRLAGGDTTTPVISGTGTVIHGTYGDLTLNADGSYDYVAKPGVSGTDHFVYTIKDGDGDLSTTTLDLTVNKAAAAVGSGSVFMSEEVLPTGSEFGVALGSDLAEDVLTANGNLTLTDSISGATFVVTLTAPAGSYSSLGVPIVWTLSNGGHTLTGTAGANTVITVTIDNSGHYVTTLSGPLDTPNGVPGENGGNGVIAVTVNAVDNFGNVATSGTLTINIQDDVPQAHNDKLVTVAEDGANVGGNVMTNDKQGADGAHVSQISFDGGVTYVDITTGVNLGGGVYQFTDAAGVYTISAAGAWTFDPALNQANGTTPTDASFYYKLLDGDGDTSTAVQPINVTDGANPGAGGTVNLSVTEGALDTTKDPNDLAAGTATGSNPGSTGETQVVAPASGLHFTAGSDDLTSVAFAASQSITVTGLQAGYTIAWSVDGSGQLVGTLMHGVTNLGTAVLVALTGNTGTTAAGGTANVGVTVTLVGPLEHSGSSITLNGIDVVASQADGDVSHGTVNITVIDDVPSFTAVIQSQQVDNNPADPVAVGSLHLNAGADGYAGAVITPTLSGITSGGHALVTQQVGNVLTAYADITGNGLSGDDTAVFTITLTPPAAGTTGGTYTFDLLAPLDGTTVNTVIGGSSSFGSGPTTSGQTLNGATSANHLAVVSGYTTSGFNEAAWLGGSAAAGLTVAGVNGSTAGWGISSNNFTTGQFFVFDFSAGALRDPDGGGGYVPPSGVTLPNASDAHFLFKGAGASDVIEYVIHLSNGTTLSGTIPASGLGAAGWHAIAPLGTSIDDVEFFAKSVGGGLKVDLEDVSSQSTVVNIDIPVSVTVTDGDGDPATSAFHVVVKDGVAPVVPNLVTSSSTSTNGPPGQANHSLVASNDPLAGHSTLGRSPTEWSLAAAIAAAGLTGIAKVAGHVVDQPLHVQSDHEALATSIMAHLPSQVEQSLAARVQLVDVRPLVDHRADHAAPTHVVAANDAAHVDAAVATHVVAPAAAHDASATHVVAGPVVAAPQLAMVSAAMLKAALGVQHGVAVDKVASNDAGHGSVDKIVADALHGGAPGPSIETLLHAVGHGANGGGAAHSTLASAPVHAVPAWDNAAAASVIAAQHVNVMANALLLHHDAIQPTAHG